MSDFLIVAVTALLSGGFAIPLGFLLDMPPLAVYAAAVLGAVLGMVVFAFVGGGIRKLAVSRMKDPEAATEKVSGLLGRWGVRGLGLVGPIFPGVTVTVIAGLAVGVDRNQLIRWMTAGILGLYAVYVVGLAILVEITGV
ncbi:MAG: small multi-drug export protein [Acidimicrobiia bacterium]